MRSRRRGALAAWVVPLTAQSITTASTRRGRRVYGRIGAPCYSDFQDTQPTLQLPQEYLKSPI